MKGVRSKRSAIVGSNSICGIQRKRFVYTIICFCLVFAIGSVVIRYYENEQSLLRGYSNVYLLTNMGFKFPEIKNAGCDPGIPCVYPDEVDFRVIVITYNRDVSLMKLLKTLDDLEMDGDTAALEIWIDQSKQGEVHNKTLEAARGFRWKHGTTTVHVQKSHVGIYGQWIDTWRPKNEQSRELALILEDDLSVCPHTYRWIKAVHAFYGSRNDYSGASLQSDEQLAHDHSRRPLNAPKNDAVFLYKCIGTWGFSPSPRYWSKFQDWFHAVINDSQFHPYVPGIIPTSWYRTFESRGTADGMWEMWFIYFAYKEQLFSVYTNLPKMNGDGESCLCINRREAGLHYGAKGPENLCKLLTRWKKEYITFPNKTTKLDWSGAPMDKYY